MVLDQFDASRRGKKGLIFSHDKNEESYGRGKSRLSDPPLPGLSELRLGREKEKEKKKCEGNRWVEQNYIIIKIETSNV